MSLGLPGSESAGPQLRSGFLFGAQKKELDMSETELILKRLSDYSNIVEILSHPSTNTDRRAAAFDRRQCQTYLATDRRSGIADRRRKAPYVPELVDILRRKRLRSQN
jgi:hypothetical protein